MPDAVVHDVLNDGDMSNQFRLDHNNTVRILLNDYDASVPADVELVSEGGYSWNPPTFQGKTIQIDGAGQEYVLVTSRPSKPGSPPGSNVILHVTVVTDSDAAQGDFPVDYVVSFAGKVKAYVRS